jgi:hypothetical protein
VTLFNVGKGLSDQRKAELAEDIADELLVGVA